MQNKFKHTYSHPSSLTPFHFRFSVSSDVHRDPSAFGRPVGVFNADCYGITPQDPNETRAMVKLEEDPNTARRFPLASSFVSKEQCALECDFWKLVLRRKYYLEIPWSHGTEAAYLEAAQFAQQEPLVRLEDESQWSHELLDFINEHLSQLFKHRDAHKPEVDLDEWARVARDKDIWQLRVWVENMREAQKDLDGLPDTGRLHTLHKHLMHLRGVRMPECGSRSEFSPRFAALTREVGNTISASGSCSDLIRDIEEKRRAYTAKLERLKNNRPSIA